MAPYQFIAQALGIVAMAFSIVSFQAKSNKKILVLQFLSNIFFFAHYVMIGAVVGALMNIVAMLRSQVYLHRERFHSEKPAWLIGFTVTYLLSYAAEFTVFGKEPTPDKLFFSSLVIIASIIYTVGFHINDATNIRKYNLIGAPLGLIYNLSVGSIGASVTEGLKIISILSAMLRLDRKKGSPKSQPEQKFYFPKEKLE